jgi:hypothetical protein
MTSLTLKEALKTNRLEDFIAQAEAEGVEAADKEELEAALAAVIKPRRSAGRTSRSASRDGSSGK